MRLLGFILSEDKHLLPVQKYFGSTTTIKHKLGYNTFFFFFYYLRVQTERSVGGLSELGSWMRGNRKEGAVNTNSINICTRV